MPFSPFPLSLSFRPFPGDALSPAHEPRPPCPVQVIQPSRHGRADHFTASLGVQTWQKPLNSAGKSALCILGISFRSAPIRGVPATSRAVAEVLRAD